MSKGSDQSRVTKAYRESPYFCETCDKGPSACKCDKQECQHARLLEGCGPPWICDDCGEVVNFDNAQDH